MKLSRIEASGTLTDEKMSERIASLRTFSLQKTSSRKYLGKTSASKLGLLCITCVYLRTSLQEINLAGKEKKGNQRHETNWWSMKNDGVLGS